MLTQTRYTINHYLCTFKDKLLFDKEKIKLKQTRLLQHRTAAYDSDKNGTIADIKH